MMSAMLAIVTSGALVLGSIAPVSEPVPVQRPSAVAPPEPAPAPEPAPMPEPAPEPAPLPRPDPAPQALPGSGSPVPESAPGARTETLGRIEGTLTDLEVEGAPVVGASVLLHCPCLPEPERTATDVDGRFAVEGLPPGTYTIVVERGGRPTKRTLTLGLADTQRVQLRVAPPISSTEIGRREAEDQRARTMIAVGSVGTAAALFMLVGAAVEANKPECKFELDDCPAAPRPAVARGLGIGGAVLAIVGGALVGVGVHRLRKLRARIELEDRALALVIAGKF